MQSRNKKAPTKAQASHIAVIKALLWSGCDEPGPSDAHEIKQGQWFTAVALCKSCHQGPKLGLHGEKGMWRIRKMDEMDALAKTIERVLT